MPNIIASYWSVAGDRYPGCGDEASPYSFKERYDTAGALGFRGAGLVYDDLLHASQTIGYLELRQILKGNGIDDLEVEILHDWFADGELRAKSDVVRAELLEAAELLGARHLKIAGDFHSKEIHFDRMAEEFAKLCKEFAEVGLTVGIEVMPFTNLRRLDESMEVVNKAGAPNGGLLLDIWHMERGGIDPEEISRLPASAIISIELNDAKKEIQGNIWSDTLNHRLPCGEGDFNIPRFLAAIEKTGYAGPVGIEIISTEQRGLPLQDAARRAIDSGRRYL